MNKIICIFHSNCADGFGAAWSVWKKMPDIEFYPGVYQNDPPDVAGKKVIMVDFSYKRPVLEKMAEAAESILILDHHKSAADDLAGLPKPEPRRYSIASDIGRLPQYGIWARFDMEKSGAILAWEYFHDEEPPQLLRHIQDRDLWKFELDGTREIQANVFSYPYDFQVWDQLMRMDVDALRRGGEAIERKHHKDIAELTKVVTRFMKIGGQVVPVANLPYTLTSDAGHLLCGDELTYPFAGCYWDTPEGRVFSLRSREGGADVAEIAKQYGGGGHEHASGFRVPYDQLDQFAV